MSCCMVQTVFGESPQTVSGMLHSARSGARFSEGENRRRNVERLRLGVSWHSTFLAKASVPFQAALTQQRFGRVDASAAS